MTGESTAGTRKTLLVGVGLAALVAAGVAVAMLTLGPDVPGQAAPVTTAGPVALSDRVAPTEKAPLPDFTLLGFTDDAPVVRASDYRGQPLVLNFWATWCAPCVEEMPALQQVADETAGDVAFLGVNVQDIDRAKAEALVDELDITYDLARDDAGELPTAVQLFGMPTTLFVNPQGTIVYRFTGPLTAGQLRDLIVGQLEVEIAGRS